MKQNLSISLSEEMIKRIEALVDGIRFRSKSHILEYSLSKFLKEEGAED